MGNCVFGYFRLSLFTFFLLAKSTITEFKENRAATSVFDVARAVWTAVKWVSRSLTDNDQERILMEELAKKRTQEQEKEFHDYVRQHVICLVLFMLMYFIAYLLVSRLKRSTENEVLYSGEEDYFVYRFSVWVCSISLAVSIGSLLLLPFSVMGVELMQLYADDYYLQWLSYSLIGSLWNYVFVLSNLSLFVLLPFSYFFIESQGFSNSKSSGIMQRLYETLAVSALFVVVLLCLAEVVLKLMKMPVSLLSITSVNLPLFYSCVSLVGAFLLIASTPYGFAKIFSFVTDLFDEPKRTEEQMETIIEETVAKDTALPSKSELNRIENGGIAATSPTPTPSSPWYRQGDTNGQLRKRHDYSENVTVKPETRTGDLNDHCTYSPLFRALTTNNNNKLATTRHKMFNGNSVAAGDAPMRKKSSVGAWQYQVTRRCRTYSNRDTDSSSGFGSADSMECHVEERVISPFDFAMVGSPLYASTPFDTPLTPRRKKSGRRTRSEEPPVTRPYSEDVNRKPRLKNVVRMVLTALTKFPKNSKRGKLMQVLASLRLPLIIVFLLLLTAVALLMVTINSLKLLFGYRSLPEYAQYIEVQTRHSFGLFGACIETAVIIYVMVVSLVGLFSLPWIRSTRPQWRNTSMVALIINCTLVLVVSSAFPVIVNTLGITTFDLLGAFSSLQWLSSFKAVLTYNLIFITLSAAHLFNQLTAPMRREIWRRLVKLRTISTKNTNFLRSKIE